MKYSPGEIVACMWADRCGWQGPFSAVIVGRDLFRDGPAYACPKCKFLHSAFGRPRPPKAILRALPAYDIETVDAARPECNLK